MDSLSLERNSPSTHPPSSPPNRPHATQNIPNHPHGHHPSTQNHHSAAAIHHPATTNHHSAAEKTHSYASKVASGSPRAASKSFTSLFSANPPIHQVPIKQPEQYKGKSAVFFSMNDREKLAEPYKYALIGKFSHGRPTMEAIRQIFSTFELKGTFSLGLLDNKHLLIRCTLEEDFTRLWLKKSWYIQRFLMRVFKWSVNFVPNEESSIAPVWISFPSLPIYLFNKSALYSIANLIGKPLKVDEPTATGTRPSVARVCVEIDVAEKLEEEVWIGFYEEEDQRRKVKDGFWQQIIYEDLPPYCQNCLHVGHVTEACKQPLAEQNPHGGGGGGAATRRPIIPFSKSGPVGPPVTGPHKPTWIIKDTNAAAKAPNPTALAEKDGQDLRETLNAKRKEKTQSMEGDQNIISSINAANKDGNFEIGNPSDNSDKEVNTVAKTNMETATNLESFHAAALATNREISISHNPNPDQTLPVDSHIKPHGPLPLSPARTARTAQPSTNSQESAQINALDQDLLQDLTTSNFLGAHKNRETQHTAHIHVSEARLTQLPVQAHRSPNVQQVQNAGNEPLPLNPGQMPNSSSEYTASSAQATQNEVNSAQHLEICAQNRETSLSSDSSAQNDDPTFQIVTSKKKRSPSKPPKSQVVLRSQASKHNKTTSL